jgi:NADPH:quinone reductase-like Zn-dependent oxidoreductase
MKAVVIYEPGAPSVLEMNPAPSPPLKRAGSSSASKPSASTVLKSSHAKGTPRTRFPRILGIEAVGLIESDPSGTFVKGQKVATCMGDMGRQFDGGCAEYTSMPVTQVMVVETELSWKVLGAVPEIL